MNKAQIYKIYINEVKVLLLPTSMLDQFDVAAKDTMVAAYTGKVKHLINYVDMCEKQNKLSSLIIHHSNLNELKKDFKSIFKINEAAGGFIQNELGEFLFIFRRGFWDLPKGKIESKETRRVAAIREVEEETGIQKVEIIKKICETHHTLRNRLGKRIIKKSHWYEMKASKQELIPQSQEDIEQALWLDLESFKEKYKPVYRNILDVIEVFESVQYHAK